MNILITGSSGMLGSALISDGISRGVQAEPIARDRLKLSTSFELRKILTSYDAIIHCAANTNVEWCELNPRECYRDNTALTVRLAKAARPTNCKFIFISSTGVYGSSKSCPYSESDKAFPTTHHHRSKFFAELKVLESHNSLIVRTGWLFGGSPLNPKNFVANRLREAKACGGVMYSDPSQFGCPTYARDLSDSLYRMLEMNATGIFNCVNSGWVSRVGFVQEIINISKIPVNVLPGEPSDFKRNARVSPNEMAINARLTEMGYPAMPTWNESLVRYFSECPALYGV